MEKPQVTRLPGGLTVISSAQPQMASAALGIWVGVGGRHESAGQSGVSHFIEHLLFKGTPTRTARAISEAIEGVGGYLNAFTSEDHTCFHARAHHSHLTTMVDVLLDMFLNSTMTPRDILRERKVIYEEIEQYNDQPAQRVHELLNSIQWPDQPLGRPLTGSRRSLGRMKRSDIQGFFQQHYRSDGIVISAAGRVDHRQLVDQIRERKNQFIPGAIPTSPPAQAARGLRIRRISHRSAQTQLALGFHTTSRRGPERHALRILNSLLGESMSSRLFQELREDRGLAYSIYSSASFWEDTGDLVIAAGVDPEKLAKVLRLIVRELQRLKKELVPDDELDRARDYVIGQFELGLEGTEHRMLAIGEQWLGWGRTFNPEEVRAAFSKVTPADIRLAARMFLVPDRTALALVTPRIPLTDADLGRIVAQLDHA